jgi:hypothetical protein
VALCPETLARRATVLAVTRDGCVRGRRCRDSLVMSEAPVTSESAGFCRRYVSLVARPRCGRVCDHFGGLRGNSLGALGCRATSEVRQANEYTRGPLGRSCLCGGWQSAAFPCFPVHDRACTACPRSLGTSDDSNRPLRPSLMDGLGISPADRHAAFRRAPSRVRGTTGKRQKTLVGGEGHDPPTSCL